MKPWNLEAVKDSKYFFAYFNGATAVKPWNQAGLSGIAAGLFYFNGATAVKPWNQCKRILRQAGTRQLQWGHGGEAVESVAQREMFVGIWLLQWGHGGEAVESRRGDSRWDAHCYFNGATAVKPWNRQGSGQGWRWDGYTSMGPRR